MLHNTTFTLDYPSSESITFFTTYRQADEQEVWADRQHLSLCGNDIIKSCATTNISQLSVIERAQLLAYLERVTSNRAFIRTENGFFGINNKKIKPGDQV